MHASNARGVAVACGCRSQVHGAAEALFLIGISFFLLVEAGEEWKGQDPGGFP